MEKTTFLNVKNKKTDHSYGLKIIKFQRRIVFPGRERLIPRSFDYYSLSHLIEGKAWYWNPKLGVRKLTRGQGILASPGFVQDYSGDHSKYIEDFICFDGPLADYFFKKAIISDGIVSIGKTRHLLSVIELALDPAEDSQLAAVVELQRLLLNIHFETKTKKVKEQRHYLNELVEELHKKIKKWWTVSEMAEFCNLSENHFRRQFHAYTGMAPKKYIDQLKMQHAAEMLCNSNDSIEKIAGMFGYSDPYHFSKTFKRLIGLSPDHYRKEHFRRYTQLDQQEYYGIQNE